MNATRPPASAAPGDELVERLRALDEVLSPTHWSGKREFHLEHAKLKARIVVREAADQLAIYARRVAELELAMVQGAVPLEGLLMSRKWLSLTNETWAEIENGVQCIRAALPPPPATEEDSR